MRRIVTTLVAAVALVVMAVPAQGASATVETEDVMGQGIPGPVYAAGAATLIRSDSGVSARLSIPTPEPGSYMYPPGNAFQPNGAVEGHPEAFSFWAFVFNHPELCSAPCDMNDIGNTPAQGGVYNVGGHVVGGTTLTLSGRISVGATTFAGVALSEPRTAHVHLAVAPHGLLDPAIMPAQITKPIGSPMYWWGALFV
jgi:hypothetical protein